MSTLHTNMTLAPATQDWRGVVPSLFPDVHQGQERELAVVKALSEYYRQRSKLEEAFFVGLQKAASSLAQVVLQEPFAPSLQKCLGELTKQAFAEADERKEFSIRMKSVADDGLEVLFKDGLRRNTDARKDHEASSKAVTALKKVAVTAYRTHQSKSQNTVRARLALQKEAAGGKKTDKATKSVQKHEGSEKESHEALQFAIKAANAASDEFEQIHHPALMLRMQNDMITRVNKVKEFANSLLLGHSQLTGKTTANLQRCQELTAEVDGANDARDIALRGGFIVAKPAVLKLTSVYSEAEDVEIEAVYAKFSTNAGAPALNLTQPSHNGAAEHAPASPRFNDSVSGLARSNSFGPTAPLGGGGFDPQANIPVPLQRRPTQSVPTLQGHVGAHNDEAYGTVGQPMGQEAYGTIGELPPQQQQHHDFQHQPSYSPQQPQAQMYSPTIPLFNTPAMPQAYPLAGQGQDYYLPAAPTNTFSSRPPPGRAPDHFGSVGTIRPSHQQWSPPPTQQQSYDAPQEQQQSYNSNWPASNQQQPAAANPPHQPVAPVARRGPPPVPMIKRA